MCPIQKNELQCIDCIDCIAVFYAINCRAVNPWKIRVKGANRLRFQHVPTCSHCFFRASSSKNDLLVIAEAVAEAVGDPGHTFVVVLAWSKLLQHKTESKKHKTWKKTTKCHYSLSGPPQRLSQKIWHAISLPLIAKVAAIFWAIGRITRGLVLWLAQLSLPPWLLQQGWIRWSNPRPSTISHPDWPVTLTPNALQKVPNALN